MPFTVYIYKTEIKQSVYTKKLVKVLSHSRKLVPVNGPKDKPLNLPNKNLLFEPKP